ncbi:MAG: hypothetical protein MHMPM18_002972 [Marteilia pararefringens]
MPKLKASEEAKAQQVAQNIPDEFMVDYCENLYCKYCNVTVKCDKYYYVEEHRSTKKHSNSIENSPKQPKLTNMNKNESYALTERVTKAFLSANIPLKKMQNKDLNDLFLSTGYPLPRETLCRNQVGGIFVVFDELQLGIFFMQIS